jgi:rare lipoprotein A
MVLASWYGPGFYGNRTACGQTYTPQISGVAHRTLPCGTILTLEYGGRSVTVAVIDRGPYIAGRTLDLSNATRLALGCTDLCTLSMRIGP